MNATVGGRSDQRVTWTSSNPSVVAVTAEGLATALWQGEAVVAAVVAQGQGQSASARIRVIAPIALSLEPRLDTLAVGQAASFSAWIGNALDPGLIWRSSNSAVLAVDPKGGVLALGAGSAVITVISREDTTTRAEAAVVVLPAVQLQLNSFGDTIAVGDSLRLQARLVGARDRTLRWSSSSAGVVAVDQAGLVRGLGIGSASVTATANADPAAHVSAQLVVASLRLSTLAGDGQTGMVETALDDSVAVRVTSVDGTPVRGMRVSWSPGNASGSAGQTATATDGNGVAQALWTLPSQVGPATLTASVAGLRRTLTATAFARPALPMLAPDTADYIPAVGTVRTAVFLIDFSDAVATITPDDVYRQLLDPAAAMFASFSSSRMQLALSGPRRWIRMPRTAAAYVAGGLTDANAIHADLLALMDPEIDFSTYDQIYLVFSNTGPVRYTSLNTWPKGYTPYHADGREIRVFVWIGLDALNPGYPPGYVALWANARAFGLPDLQVGAWDPMGGWVSRAVAVRDFLAANKARLGWLQPGQVKAIVSSRGVEELIAPINSAAGTKAVAAPLDAHSVLMAEVRDGSAGVCRAGVLLYVVERWGVTDAGSLTLIPAHPDGADVSHCGSFYNAPFQPGESYTHSTGIRIDVLEGTPEGYRVRVRTP